jgi:hypothetical protein
MDRIYQHLATLNAEDAAFLSTLSGYGSSFPYVLGWEAFIDLNLRFAMKVKLQPMSYAWGHEMITNEFMMRDWEVLTPDAKDHEPFEVLKTFPVERPSEKQLRDMFLSNPEALEKSIAGHMNLVLARLQWKNVNYLAMVPTFIRQAYLSEHYELIDRMASEIWLTWKLPIIQNGQLLTAVMMELQWRSISAVVIPDAPIPRVDFVSTGFGLFQAKVVTPSTIGTSLAGVST